MTREETKQLLMTIRAIYPNFSVKAEEMTPTINAWYMMLEEYPANLVNGALQVYVKSNNTGFAPSVSQLIGAMHKPAENDQMSEGEAWNLVKRAIQNSGYHSAEEYEKLPPIVQRCVGSPNMLFQWSQTDSNEVNTVVMSNFQRTYRAVLEKQDFKERIPEPLYDLVKGLADKVSSNNLLEDKNV